MNRPIPPGTPGAGARDEVDLDEEFEAHLAHRIDDLVAGGLDAAEARRRALAEFGDVDRLKESSRSERSRARRRAQRGWWREVLAQDVAYTLRQLRRSPGFALTALATLALGVGATTTIVSVVDAVVLEPLPFQEPDRVVFAEMETPDGGAFSVSEPVFLDWRERVRSFDDISALRVSGITLEAPGIPRSVDVAAVDHRLLRVLGLAPTLGRMLTADEDAPNGSPQVALLSQRMWRTEMGADPDVVGTTIRLVGRTFEVVGVMPEGVDLVTGGASVFLPLAADPQMDRGDHYLDVVARVAADASTANAEDELRSVQADLNALYAGHEGWSARLLTAEEYLIGEPTVRAGWMLLTAAGVFLLMACLNVSNLLVVRSTTRRGEIGLRAALGAARGRLAGQLFTETAVLALVGGALGVVLAIAALPTVRALGGARVPRLDQASLDGTALAASLLAVSLGALLCSLAPVAQIGGAIRRGPLVSVGTRHTGRNRLRSSLVTAQVSLTVVLLVGAGLLARSFIELSRTDPGFEPSGTLAVQLQMPNGAYTWADRGELFPRIREAVASLPGVTAVGATSVEPFQGVNLANFAASLDRLPDRAADFTPVSWRSVTPGFFEAMGMEVRSGRGFTEADSFDGPPSVVIGVSLARALWGDEPAVGKTLVWGDPEGTRLVVIGVVEDLRDVELAGTPRPIVYRAYSQVPWFTATLVARVDGDPISIASGIRSRIQEVAPELPVPDLRTLESNISQSVAEPRFNLQLFSSFALVGLLLAVVGLYGMTAFDVRRRFREIGIRLSLGAEQVDIRSMILRQRMASTGLGIAVGLVVAWVAARAIESQLYGITPHDPLTWSGVVALTLGASWVATYLPTRRATRVDPRDVLSSE